MISPATHKSLRPRRGKKRRNVLLLQYWWEERVFSGVARYAAEHDWILDCEMRWTGKLPKSRWHGEGIIAYFGIANPQKHLIAFAKSAGVPLVEMQIPQRIPGSGSVVIAHEQVGELAAEHLLSLDFRHIGFVAFAENIFEDIRRRGAKNKVTAAGASFHSLDFASFSRRLARLPKPLGLIALNDINARNVIIACKRNGYRVPEDIAVIGADDTDVFCDLSAIPISSVNCNYEEQGYRAAALLDAKMSGERPPQEHIVIQPKGVSVRRSTDTVAIPDSGSAQFLRFLRDHYKEALSLDKSGRELGVSMRRVQEHFRRHLGTTVVQELTRLRVEHAKRLLHDPDLKTEAVGAESGFANRFHFIRAFSRMTGQTPAKFRARLMAEAERIPTGLKRDAAGAG